MITTLIDIVLCRACSNFHGSLSIMYAFWRNGV
jgi:hypothetical protein